MSHKQLSELIFRYKDIIMLILFIPRLINSAKQYEKMYLKYFWYTKVYDLFSNIFF